MRKYYTKGRGGKKHSVVHLATSNGRNGGHGGNKRNESTHSNTHTHTSKLHRCFGAPVLSPVSITHGSTAQPEALTAQVNAKPKRKQNPNYLTAPETMYRALSTQYAVPSAPSVKVAIVEQRRCT